MYLLTVISSVQCQNTPSVVPNHVEKNEGESAEVVCTFGRPVERCRFIKPNQQSIRIRENAEGKYEYAGSGFSDGQCGIRISNLDKNDEGNWSCSLDVGDDLDDIIGNFTITITKSPSNLALYVPEGNNLREGFDMQAECTFNDGIPPAAIEWFLGDEIVQPREATASEISGEIVVTSVFRRTLRASDNLKPLICRINHSALGDGFMNMTHQLHVNFPPQALSRQELYISGLTIGSSADIEVKIRANPKPRLQWTIDGKTMREGTQNDRYVVNGAVQIENSLYSAKLTLSQLRLEDTTKVYTLRADNEWGSQDYAIRIGGSPDEQGEKSFKVLNKVNFSLHFLLIPPNTFHFAINAIISLFKNSLRTRYCCNYWNCNRLPRFARYRGIACGRSNH